MSLPPRIFILGCILFCTIFTPSFGQKKKAAETGTTLSGRVIDSENGDPLQSCTVILTKSDTTGMVAGGISNANGNWTVKNVQDGQYVVKISFIGYHTFYRAVKVEKNANGTQNLGTVLLTPSNIELKGAVVTGQLKEVEVKEDTIIFNADAFKVPEGSVLEELIRKLPGAEVGDDGTVKINGKTVKKILVEGKEFFGNDKNMSMKNLPTEIVDKIKSYDRQSDFSRITGIDDGEEETVIDIGIKKGMKQGWFGNVDLSYGTKDRFAERLMVNRFTDKLQASFIGSINNTGDQTGGGGGRGGNNGITTSGMAGANIAADLKKLELGGNVRFSGRKTNSQSYSSSQNFVSSSSSFSNSRNASLNKNYNTNGDFKIEWKPDSLTTLLFRPSFSVGDTDSESQSLSASFNADPYTASITNPLDQLNEVSEEKKVNNNLSSSWSDGSSYNLSGNMTLNRRLGGSPLFGPMPEKGSSGRNISLRLSGSTNGTESRNYNFSDVIYYQRRTPQGTPTTDLTYRHRDTPSWNRNFSAGLSYSEPILRNLFAQLNYSYNYSKRHSDGQTYDFGKIDSIGRILWEDYGQYGLLAPNYLEFLSDSLSRYTENINKTHNVNISLRYITSLLNISAGVRFEQQSQQMAYQYQGLDTLATRHFTRVSPTLNARFRFNKQHTLRLTYRGQTQQPDMTSLFNLTDNSNPLNIREGNPDLKPSFSNNINLDYNNYLQERQQSIFGRFSFSNTLNAITNRTEYNALTGGQRTRPENIDGNWNLNGNIGFNTPLFWEKLSLNTNTSAGYQHHVGYIYQNHETQTNTVRQTSLGEWLSLTLRMGYWDIRANGSINWSRSRSDIVESTNQNTFNFHYGLSSTGNFENGLGFSTDIGMSSRRGYSSSEMNTNELIWNAQLSYRFLKNRQATISIQAFDILGQRSNISRTITAYSRRDSENNSINSYVMFHFIYRLNMFGNREARQAMRNMRNQDGGYERQNFGEEGGGRGAGGRGGGGGRGTGGGGFGGGRGGF
ncbi:MAG: TonB-dependent receptor [Bacteroidaceae bacterium]|nr:TonB-dependent receptor [Bacteroidaceae bacterium]